MSTPSPGPVRRITPAATTARSQRSAGAMLIAAAAVVIILLALIRLFGHHENKYEKMAADVTRAIQSNNMAPVAGLFNAETRDRSFTKVRVARASDDLAPLGKITGVKETTGANAPPNGHSFDVTGEHGTAHEQMVLDSDGKIASFHYQDIAPAGK